MQLPDAYKLIDEQRIDKGLLTFLVFHANAMKMEKLEETGYGQESSGERRNGFVRQTYKILSMFNLCT